MQTFYTWPNFSVALWLAASAGCSDSEPQVYKASPDERADGGTDAALTSTGSSGPVIGDGGPGSPTCDDLLTFAGTETTALLANADKTCRGESDCVEAPSSLSCESSRCGAAWVSDAGAALIAATVPQLERAACVPYVAKGCPAPVEPPCVALGPYQHCVDGKCK